MTKLRWLRGITISFTFIATILGLTFIYQVYTANGFTKLHLSGDAIGGVAGSLFGLASTLLLFLALMEQIYQNQKQNEEIKKSNQRLEKQLFDNQFFKLIEIHQSLIKDFDLILNPESHEKSGKDCFKVIYEHIEAEGEEILEKKYETLMEDFQDEMPTFENSALTIIDMVEDEEVSENYKKFFFGTMNQFERKILQEIILPIKRPKIKVSSEG